MPKQKIDYSNTIVYKLEYNNFMYISYTTNFTQRKALHKDTCLNKNRNGFNDELYKTIRKNGGWYKWNMVMIGEYQCKNKLEAYKKTYEWVKKLKPNLNNITLDIPKLYMKLNYSDNFKMEMLIKEQSDKFIEKHLLFKIYMINNDVMHSKIEKLSLEKFILLHKLKYNKF